MPNFVVIKNEEDFANFDFSRVVVEPPKQMDIKKEDNNKKGKSKGKSKSSMSYGSMSILYRYEGSDIPSALLIQLPKMDMSGIYASDEYTDENGAPKNQIATKNVLSAPRIKFLKKLRAAIMNAAADQLKDEKNLALVNGTWSFDIDDFNPDAPIKKNFRPLYRSSKARPTDYKMYFRVRPYTKFFIPVKSVETKKGESVKQSKKSEPVQQKVLMQTKSRQLKLEASPIWKLTYIYIGNSLSIISHVDEVIIYSVSKVDSSSMLDDHMDELIDEDYDEDSTRRVLAELDCEDSDEDSDDDEGSDDDSFKKPKKTFKVPEKKISNFKKMMDDEDDDEDDEPAPPKKSKKKAAVVSDDEDD